MILNLFALVWGFAEATVFFIVPDVWLSVVAITRGTRAALIACFWAVAGALAGGTVMYFWSAGMPELVAAILDMQPGVGPQLVGAVRQELSASGVTALVAGTFSGVPYKLYAAQAMHIEPPLPLALFLIASLASRLTRFLLVAIIVGWIGTNWARELRKRTAVLTLLLLWTAYYALYFIVLPD